MEYPVGVAAQSMAQMLSDLRNRKRSAVDVVGVMLTHLEAIGNTGAFVMIDREDLRRQAALSDRRLAAGRGRPLESALFALKDLIALRGWPMKAGTSLILRRPERDSVIAAQLRRLGALIVGTTQTHELAFGVTGINANGTPLNPRYPRRIPGGSSSGSAAAVALRAVHVAIGTDTGGSVRIPAACCGVVGFKPSFGAVSMRGVLHLAPSMDHVGFLTPSVADLQTFWAAAFQKGPVAHKPALSIGVIRGALDNADSMVRAAFEGALSHLSRAGATIIHVDAGDPYQWSDVSTTVLLYEAHRQHRKLLAHHPGVLGSDVRDRLDQGRSIPTGAYRHALNERAWLTARLDLVLRRVDLVACPTLPQIPPLLEQAEDAHQRALLTQNTRMHNLTGVPAISIPLPVAIGPVSLQVAAARGRDNRLIAQAAWIEGQLDRM